MHINVYTYNCLTYRKMETIIVVLRPKLVSTVSREFSAGSFDVLLTDVKSSVSDKSTTIKQLPKTDISYEQEPADGLFDYLYNLTGAQYGGIKGLLRLQPLVI